MLVRLLVAVLTLVGPMSFRACTCAAAHAHASEGTSAPDAHPDGKTCRCTHHTSADDTRSTDRAATAESDGEGHPAQHERDCPAANPAPVVREAVPQTAADAPADSDAAHAAAWAESPPGVGCPVAPAFERPRAPKNPLYLTLLTLRN
jgi:hypothetical protein